MIGRTKGPDDGGVDIDGNPEGTLHTPFRASGDCAREREVDQRRGGRGGPAGGVWGNDGDRPGPDHTTRTGRPGEALSRRRAVAVRRAPPPIGAGVGGAGGRGAY